MARYRIGELARAADVKIATIRYYERRGILPEPPRRESGYREYDQDSVARLRFVKRAQRMGFSLVEIETLLALRVDAEQSCEEVRKQAETKLAEIEEKIQALQELRLALGQLVAACEVGGPKGECPLLQALEEQSAS